MLISTSLPSRSPWSRRKSGYRLRIDIRTITCIQLHKSHPFGLALGTDKVWDVARADEMQQLTSWPKSGAAQRRLLG